MKMLRNLFASLMLAGIFVTSDVNAMQLRNGKQVHFVDQSDLRSAQIKANLVDLPEDGGADINNFTDLLTKDASLGAKEVDLSRAFNAAKACGCVGLLAGSLAVGENSHYISFPMFWAGLTGTVYYGYKTITGSK